VSIEVKVPQLPESVADATLVAWHKKAGETVRREENLVDLETDKVVLEVPAPVDGVLKQIVAADGAVVTSGQVLALLEPGEVAAAPKPAAAKAAPAPAARPAPSPAPATAKPAMRAIRHIRWAAGKPHSDCTGGVMNSVKVPIAHTSCKLMLVEPD